MDTIEFTEEAVKDYLDKCILHWRKKKSEGNEIALYYIDAYQSIRSSIFGVVLNERYEINNKT